MRSSSFLAIFSGLCFLAFIAAMPAILTWQAHHALTPPSAPNQFDLAIQASLDRLKMARIVGIIVAAMLLSAGVLIGVRRKSGYYLLVALCSIAVAEALFTIVQGQIAPGGALLRVLLWGGMLTFVVRRQRRYGERWWRAALSPHAGVGEERVVSKEQPRN